MVVVANIQASRLKTEVGKGSARTAVGGGSVGPKLRGKPTPERRSVYSITVLRPGTRFADSEREVGLTFRHLGVGEYGGSTSEMQGQCIHVC